MRYDKIIVIDIESTCWKENTSKEVNDIIEIGICPIETKYRKVLEPVLSPSLHLRLFLNFAQTL